MSASPKPPNERARLAALYSYEILDSLPEVAFDEVVTLASEICGVPIALVSMVDAERQWFKAAKGLDATETERSAAFCAHAILQPDVFIVPDATLDERFAGNRLVVGEPHVRFYAGKPLESPTGERLGTLCVIDRVPRELSSFQTRALLTLGRQVEAHLELRKAALELLSREQELRKKHEALTRLQLEKEELTSLLVHDLKTPLSVIAANAAFLRDDETVSLELREAAEDIELGAEAMSRMVVDLLDIQHAEQGGLVPSLRDVDLDELISRVRSGAARRAGRAPQEPTPAQSGSRVRADPDLLRRVLENLVDNAVKYGGARPRIEIVAHERLEGIEIVVSDDGPGIPASQREAIFARYARLGAHADVHAGSSRGLGLHFCKRAVEAQGGRIWVDDNTPHGSAFHVTLPR